MYAHYFNYIDSVTSVTATFEGTTLACGAQRRPYVADDENQKNEMNGEPEYLLTYLDSGVKASFNGTLPNAMNLASTGSPLLVSTIVIEYTC